MPGCVRFKLWPSQVSLANAALLGMPEALRTEVVAVVDVDFGGDDQRPCCTQGGANPRGGDQGRAERELEEA